MTAIKKVKDKEGTQFFPVTHERAVRDDDGTTLESKLQNIGSGVSTILPNIYEPTSNLIRMQDGEFLVNGVTITTKATGKLSLSGTATSAGGRLTRLCAPFTLAAGTYFFGVSGHSGTFLEDTTTNAVVVSANHTFTLAADTSVYLGVNVENGTTYAKDLNVVITLSSASAYEPPFTAVDKDARENSIAEYNILNYPGDTLNARWNAMKASFLSWQKKTVLIPYPRAEVSACIKVGNDYKWKVDGALVFDDTCNEMDIWVEGELLATSALSQVLVFDDASKPENIYFHNGISIRGDRQNNHTITNAIEIRSAARLNFSGQVMINDCYCGIVIGGALQSAPAEAKFDYINIGFADKVGISVGGSFPCYFNARNVDVQCMQTADKNAVEISDNCVQFYASVVHYGTDVAKNGYTTFDAKAVISISQTDAANLIHNVIVDEIYGTTSQYGVYAVGKATGSCYDLFFKTITIPGDSCVAIYAKTLGRLFVESVGKFNTIEVDDCIFSRINGLQRYSDSTLYKDVEVNDLLRDPGVGILDKPTNMSNRFIGAETLLSYDFNEVGPVHIDKTYRFTGSDMIPSDGQMFTPIIASLPTPRWYWRGKFFCVLGGTGIADGVYVCIKKADGTYEWRNLIV